LDALGFRPPANVVALTEQGYVGSTGRISAAARDTHREHFDTIESDFDLSVTQSMNLAFKT